LIREAKKENISEGPESLRALRLCRPSVIQWLEYFHYNMWYLLISSDFLSFIVIILVSAEIIDVREIHEILCFACDMASGFGSCSK
jgi:hypothetical protein